MPRVSRLSRQSGIVAFCLAVPLNWAAIAATLHSLPWVRRRSRTAASWSLKAFGNFCCSVGMGMVSIGGSMPGSVCCVWVSWGAW